MAQQHISESLKRFIREHIQTVFRLEALLLLHRNQSRSFTAAEIADELGFEDDVAEQQLTALAAAGILTQSNSDEFDYCYTPDNEAVGFMVDQLAVSYSKQRVPILSLILAERSDSTRVFAEAFRLIRRND